MITQDKALRPTMTPNDVALLSDLHREIVRLESKRDEAARRSDELFSQLCNDDTGFSFHQALTKVNHLNERIQKLRDLADSVRSRVSR